MVIYNSFNNPKLIKLIKDGGIGVIPTDTIYGLICSANDREAVNALYKIKGRDTDKPLIILISNIKELRNYGVVLSKIQLDFLKKNWPGKKSIIFSAEPGENDYLQRGSNTLTFRLPADNKLLSLLQKTGPLVAPSANPQGKSPAENIDDIMNYFIGQVDFVVDGGNITGVPSTLVSFVGDKPKVLRQGTEKII